MDNLLPMNSPTKLIRPPTLKRSRLGDSQSGKVRNRIYYKLYARYIKNNLSIHTINVIFNLLFLDKTRKSNWINSVNQFIFRC